MWSYIFIHQLFYIRVILSYIYVKTMSSVPVWFLPYQAIFYMHQIKHCFIHEVVNIFIDIKLRAHFYTSRKGRWAFDQTYHQGEESGDELSGFFRREGGVSKVTTGLVLTASMTSRLASVTFKMAAKVVVDEADKIVEFRMDNLINFIRFSDNKIPIVIEIRNLVPLLDETFRSVMNFNGSFLSSSKSAEQSYQPVRLSRASAQQVGGV